MLRANTKNSWRPWCTGKGAALATSGVSVYTRAARQCLLVDFSTWQESHICYVALRPYICAIASCQASKHTLER